MNLKELKNLDKKLIFLQNVNGDRLGVLNAYDVTFSPRFNNVSTLSFTIFEDDCLYYNLIKSWMRIELQDICVFLVQNPVENNDGLRKSKTFTCNSLEFDINRKMIPSLKGMYKFYSILPEDETIISIVMSHLPNWTLESVSSELWNKYRTFDEENISVYQLVMNTIEEKFECVFIFNTILRTISVKSFSDIPKTTDIFLSFNNLVNEIEITENTESLVTSMEVYGADESLSINLVNPLGKSIYNFQHFTGTIDRNSGEKYMSDGLISKITNWQTLIDTYQVDYTTHLTNRKTKISERITLETQLTTLKSEYDAIEVTRDALLESGLNATIKNTELSNKQIEIDNKQTEISVKQTEIDNIETDLNAIQNAISLTSYFSPTELLELENFTINVIVKDDSFVVVSTDSDLDIQETAQDLYDKYKRYLDINSKLKYKFSIDLINYLPLKEYQIFTNQMEFGITVNLDCDNGQIAHPMLLGLDISLDNDEVQFLFSEELRYETSAMSYEDYISNQLSSVANIVYGDKHSWGQYISSGSKDKLDNIFKNGLSADLIPIKNADNEEFLINKNGLLARELLIDGTYNPEQLKIIHNKLAFTDDNFNSLKTVVGKVTLPDNSQAYGVNCEVLMGKLILANQLVISNSANTFTVDSAGATLLNASLSIENTVNKILLDPTNGFKMQKNVNFVWTDMIYMDTEGDANYKGKILASEIDGSTIKGGSIFIGGSQTELDCVFGVTNTGKILGLETDNGLFSVNEFGSVVLNGGLVLGGSITWNTHDPTIATAQSTATDALDVASDAQIVATSASGNIAKLSNGTYLGGTFIDGTIISSPNIEGGRISGGEFCDLYNKGKLVLNPTNSSSNNADLYLYSGSNVAFNIYDGLSYISLTGYGNNFLTVSSIGTTAEGDWNFTGNVTGVVAKFA